MFNYVVSRAVMPLDALIKACAKNINRTGKDAGKYAPGIVCLKGGELNDEIAAAKRTVIDVPVTDFFNEPFFETKKIIYVPF